jgi:type IV pilus assembly protein PilW
MNMHKQRGLSLIELLVALGIGGFLIIGAVTVQTQTRKTFSVNENQARLQETARFVLSVIEPEVQLAGLMGFSNNPNGLEMKTTGAYVPVSSLRMGKAATSGIPAVLEGCGANYVLDVTTAIRADNGTWTMTCGAQGGGFIAGTDTLTIRRASVEKAAPEVGRIQVYSNRLLPDTGKLFMDGAAPDVEKDRMMEVRNLIMNAYYISRDSDGRPGLPSLRLKQISAKSGAGEWLDQEIVRGVEDFQVELGIDPGQDTNGDGIPDDEHGDGMVDNVNGVVARYVQPGSAILNTGAQIVAVRLWVRVRAEEAEEGFRDNRNYKYGSTDFTANDNLRRVVMSRTIFVRNSRVYPET